MTKHKSDQRLVLRHYNKFYSFIAFLIDNDSH